MSFKVIRNAALMFLLVVSMPLLARAADPDPSGANTGKASDITAATPGSPTLEEVAAAVVFLVSPLASGITGVTLPVDAGWSSSARTPWHQHDE